MRGEPVRFCYVLAPGAYTPPTPSVLRLGCQLLLSRGARLEHNFFLLHIAAHRGDPDMLRLITADPFFADPDVVDVARMLIPKTGVGEERGGGQKSTGRWNLRFGGRCENERLTTIQSLL